MWVHVGARLGGGGGGGEGLEAREVAGVVGRRDGRGRLGVGAELAGQRRGVVSARQVRARHAVAGGERAAVDCFDELCDAK